MARDMLQAPRCWQLVTSGHYFGCVMISPRFYSLLPNKPRGVPRVDDRRVNSGTINVIRNGLIQKDAPVVHGPSKLL